MSKTKKKAAKKGNGLTSAEIGNTMRQLRTGMGMTTTVFAQKVGISQAQVSRLECGQQGFRSGTAIKIAQVLKIRPWALFMTPDERAEVSKSVSLQA